MTALPQMLGACGPDCALVDDLVPSPNIGARRHGGSPRFLIMHYTGLESAERSIAVLSDPVCEVSCHYVIDVDGHIIQMVREADRAWHAGLSYWQGETDINSYSIGIEIQNPGDEDFPDRQMASVEALARDIIHRHGMRPEHVLAHSDIAPQRKIDPGEKFDWRRLHRAGIGHLTAPHTPSNAPDIDPGRPDERVRTLQELLAVYGYEILPDGLLTAETRRVFSAFQSHFRPARVDGLPDVATIATAADLIAALDETPRAAGAI